MKFWKEWLPETIDLKDILFVFIRKDHFFLSDSFLISSLVIVVTLQAK